jgi:glycyl-tRNA synthetase
MEKVVALCKRRGFVYPGSEIYGGLANTWDYGPYGSVLKKNVKDIWWKTFVQDRDDMVGLDAAILMNPRTWEASGHVASFSDPLIDCKKCKTRHRGDKLLEAKIGNGPAAAVALKDIHQKLIDEKIACPDCGAIAWTEAKKFNLMFKTQQGVIEGETNQIYLRPETAQGIFVNFKNVIDTCRVRVPFGIGQIGKAFRNEITPGNFTYRTREFEQMEIEYFVHPDQKKEKFMIWKQDSKDFFTKVLGIKEDNLRFREHEKDELSHYSALTFDVEYRFPFGSIKDGGETWGELQGLADRANFDLTQHEKFSGQDLKYRDPMTSEVYLPHVIEPSFGLDRTVLTVLIDAYNEEKLEDGERVVMKFKPSLAPVQVAVFPLLKNKEELIKKASALHKQLKPHFRTEWDDNGNVGKRYRRQDEIGTPYCVTVDFDSLEKDTVTVRDRDTMKQDVVLISDLQKYLADKLAS